LRDGKDRRKKEEGRRKEGRKEALKYKYGVPGKFFFFFFDNKI